MTAKVLKLQPKPAPKRPVRKPAKLAQQASRSALIPAAVFAAGLALSLSHQAHGVAAATSVAPWEGWATALQIDCGFLAAKGLPYMARSAEERQALERWTKPLAWACFALCAWFNASGYCNYVPSGGVRVVIGCLLGGFVPGVMLSMSQVARILWLGRS